ncbi:hypothetical protein GGR54DRAFT_611305 [Hypoxylon sp. NC1633]|nr:hypothetical protein GGR54DRAFT_611305 [Hypoxylon sp. NC1633]
MSESHPIFLFSSLFRSSQILKSAHGLFSNITYYTRRLRRLLNLLCVFLHFSSLVALQCKFLLFPPYIILHPLGRTSPAVPCTIAYVIYIL